MRGLLLEVLGVMVRMMLPLFRVICINFDFDFDFDFDFVGDLLRVLGLFVFYFMCLMFIY